ncbi:MAG: hypothetical protein ACKV0T_02240 [Planctomycetales bacterium]
MSAKRYTFFASHGLAVTGQVDEYEAETIWLRVEGPRDAGEMLRRVAEGANFAVFRLRQSLAEDVSSDAESGAAADVEI